MTLLVCVVAALSRSPVGRLVLVLKEAVDVAGVKPTTGKSDPYCEVSMGTTLHKTKVIPNTLNPKWNSSMQFPIKSVEDDVLCFTVFDQDRFSPNDFLGRTELRVKDILRETREKRGPVMKYARLQEVNTGDIVVKLDLQLYNSSQHPVPSIRLPR
ncbi:ITSN1 [Bugula neritina]|uniref:ITSN1 n=1 Tax=Bugula neritina TaxID=10212 RepID=A0A7J7KRY0_BUGNE|nr:ITSN1 [Bugula neritina]